MVALSFTGTSRMAINEKYSPSVMQGKNSAWIANLGLHDSIFIHGTIGGIFDSDDS